MKKYIILLLAATVAFGAKAQQAANAGKGTYQKVEKRYRYRVSFTDKKNCGFSIKHPEAFLSPKSIERRKRYGLKVDAHDLPVSPQYLQQLTALGLKLCNKSKWNNTAVVETADTLKMQQVRALPFVSGARCVWEGPDSLPACQNADTRCQKTDRRGQITDKRDTLANYYGHAATQVEMLNVDKLHQAGFRGEGVTIAVIDGGFYNADLIKGLRSAKILGTRNFVCPERSIYEEQSHGMMVLSCIAANVPHSLVGTAPEASFYLLQSEDGATEQLVEEDNWCAAVEYADSLGCDMVTSSLGYYTFDHGYMSHKYYEQDGRTALNSRSASLAASRGILLLNSAGNAADEPWKKIGFPADGHDMLAVGAVNKDKRNANFSSIGPSADGRVKPDVMAMGQASAVYDIDGTVTRVNGTSFSTPILCGAVACLVQAFPEKQPVEIIRALRRSGHNVSHPDNIYGYGIPDLAKAVELLKR